MSEAVGAGRFKVWGTPTYAGPALIITRTGDTRVLEALEPQREAILETGAPMVVLPDLDHGQLVIVREAVHAVALPFLSE